MLAVFLLLHIADLALGLISVEAMDAARPVLMDAWASGPGTVLLGGAFAVHVGLTLLTLYRRRTLKMGMREAIQIGFGLAIPLLLAGHVVGTRIVPGLTGHWLDFRDVVSILWVRKPADGLQQLLVLILAWTHVGLGLWFWLRSRTWFPRVSAAFVAAALIVPMLAMLGFAEAGKALDAARLPPPSPPPVDPVPLTVAIQLAFVGLVALMLLARLVRAWRRRHRMIHVSYPDGRAVAVPAGATVLEASRLADYPHVAVCGGRGRCSTCRIRVPQGLERQPPPHSGEAATLQRFGAAPDIRLACQLRPTHDLTVFPVFATAPVAPGGDARTERPGAASHERELAVLFCDLRGFTRRVERWLPFDTVYMLNRYFEIVGRAVHDAEGHLDKFIGDGALALFGLSSAPEHACRQAVAAAGAIARGLGALNAEMAAELVPPLRIAMGLHAGPSIVGEMGYGQTIGLTAVGDAVNVASRLEGIAKEMDVEAVISMAVAERAGLDISGYAQRHIEVRGRKAEIEAVMVADASALGAALAAGSRETRLRPAPRESRGGARGDEHAGA